MTAVAQVDDAAWAGPWRAFPVGAKVSLSAGLVLTALLAPTWPGTVLVGASALAAMTAARVGARLILVVLAAPAAAIALGAASVVLTVGDPGPDALWRWGLLGVPADAPARAASLLAHGLGGTTAALLLATTTPMVDLLTWLRRLRVPDACLDVAALMYRLVFVLAEVTLAVLAAQRQRLGGPRDAGIAMGVVLLRSWERAHRLADGLRGRGYDGSLRTLRPRTRPAPAFAALSVALPAAIWVLSLAATR